MVDDIKIGRVYRHKRTQARYGVVRNKAKMQVGTAWRHAVIYVALDVEDGQEYVRDLDAFRDRFEEEPA